MKGFFKFIGYCFAAWVIWMGMVCLYGMWFVDKAEDVVKYFYKTCYLSYKLLLL